MNRQELLRKMAHLETENEDLLEEIYETDLLMRQIGFSQGLATVKAVALDMCDEPDSD